MIQQARPALELAEILRSHAESYRRQKPISPEQSAVITQLMQCRTAALGGHVEQCGNCNFQKVSYNSCRNRHCPKCQGSKRAAWIEQRLERVLPVPHFHVVFTVPDLLNPLMLQNRRLLYKLLFDAASQTLLQLAADPNRLGARIGFTAILHTWGQNLLFHPHLHCVVTGGGLSPDGKRWKPARPKYLLPVKVMSKLFRGKFLAGLKKLNQAGRLAFSGSTAKLGGSGAFGSLLKQLYSRDWVVYAKPPFGGAEQVYRYLGRYTHRVAITNRRLAAHENDRVTFSWKDYADDCRKKRMTLSAMEFIRRFLLHVLPKRFVRIRHYGLLASGNVNTKLAICQSLLGVWKPTQPEPLSAPTEEPETANSENRICPRCGSHMQLHALDSPNDETLEQNSSIAILDSS